MTDISCPICANPAPQHVFSTPPMPVASATLMRSAQAALELERRALEMWACTECEFLWNNAFNPQLVNYDADYEGTQIHSPHFAAYLKDLARHWHQQLDLDDGCILETGCGQGEFLEALSDVTNSDLIGFDPAIRKNSAGRARLIAQNLPSPDSQTGDSLPLVTTAFSRMTLEHIDNPVDFTLKQRVWLAPGGLLGVQVPNATLTIEDARACELQYEHVNYFTARSLLALFTRIGMSPTFGEIDYGDQHLTVFGKQTPTQPANAIQRFPSLEYDWNFEIALERFERKQATFGPSWQKRLAKMVLSQQEIWVWGAGSRATAFCANLPDPSVVSGVIDINPIRLGTFVPGSDWKTFAPDHLAGRKQVIVLIMNAVYEQEITRQLAQMGTSATVVCVDV